MKKEIEAENFRVFGCAWRAGRGRRVKVWPLGCLALPEGQEKADQWTQAAARKDRLSF